MKYALQAIQPLNRYSIGRVILLGDAVSDNFDRGIDSCLCAYLNRGTRNDASSRSRSGFCSRGNSMTLIFVANFVTFLGCLYSGLSLDEPPMHEFCSSHNC